MRTLFIDSSKKSLSVALAATNKLLLVSNVDSCSKHSNFLMKEIISVLDKCNVKKEELDNIVVLNGPGSFTGIRVGVTIAKTLAWALSKKIYVLSNLEAIKETVIDDVIISIIYDKEKASYVGIYANNIKEEEYLDIDSDKLTFVNKNISIVSFDNNLFVQNLYDNLKINNNVKVNIINDYNYLNVINKALENNNINPHLVEPIYLKKIDAEKK